MNGTLNILLTNGTLYTKAFDYGNSPEYSALLMIAEHQVDTKLVQSIWFQPEPQQITLEDLDLG